jgi:hypothetical protein
MSTPGISPAPTHEALCGGLPGPFVFWMSISGWGWHSDTAIHILRLMVSGAFTGGPRRVGFNPEQWDGR